MFKYLTQLPVSAFDMWKVACLSCGCGCSCSLVWAQHQTPRWPTAPPAPACLPDSLFQLLKRGTVAQIEFDSAFLVKWLPAASRKPTRYFKQRKSTATVWGQWKPNSDPTELKNVRQRQRTWELNNHTVYFFLSVTAIWAVSWGLLSGLQYLSLQRSFA